MRAGRRGGAGGRLRRHRPRLGRARRSPRPWSRWGRIDVLVNNAGLGGPTPLDDPDDARWDAILATNLTGGLSRDAGGVPVPPATAAGSSTCRRSSAVSASPATRAYAASKHGVIGLTRSLALELAPREITVNAICPGWVETEMGRRGLSPFRRRGEGPRRRPPSMAPLGRVLEPDEVAGLAVYLASDEARSVTGQAIVIDGGQVMP